MLPFDKDDFLNKEKLQNVRTAVYLVESSNMKSPPRSSYGTDNDVFCQTCIGDGYIPRNIRLMYAFLDLVSPSVILDEPAILENRVVLSWKLNGCMSINKMTINIKTPSGQIQSTDLIKNGEKYVCNHDVITKQSLFTHSIPIVQNSNQDFHFSIDFLADQNWGTQTSPTPKKEPQTYLTQLRLNKNFTKEVNGRVLKNKNFTYVLRLMNGVASIFEGTEENLSSSK